MGHDTLAVIAIILAVAARRLGERRLQAMGLAFLTIAAGHALAVEATAGALGIARGGDALAPVPSLIALGAAAAVAAAAISAFPTRGIAWLGPLDGQERALEWIRVHARAIQTVLAVFAATYAVWALGLIFIWSSAADLGQVLATTLWSAVGVAAAAVAARRRSAWLGWAALAPVLFACGKAIFDANALGDRWGGAAGLVTASGLLIAGFLLRYATARTSWRVELVCLATGAVAVVQALSALDLLLPNEPHLWGVMALIVAAAVGAVSVYPFRAWRAGSAPAWSRDLATMYWAGALAVWGGAWIALTSGRWHGGALLVASQSGHVGDGDVRRGPGRATVRGAASGSPGSPGRWSQRSDASSPSCRRIASRIAIAHPADDLWALAACVVAVGWSGVRAPDLGPLRIRIVLGAVALTVYGLSLAVLELVQWISTASVQTDFERGQTAVSAAWPRLPSRHSCTGSSPETASPSGSASLFSGSRL